MFFDIFTNISIYFKQYKLDNITLYIIKLLYNSINKFDSDIAICGYKFVRDDNIEIKLANLNDSEYDKLRGESSGAGVIFGNSGGVTESVIRTLHRIMTKTNLKKDELNFVELRGFEGIKEATITIDKYKLRVAVVQQLENLEELLKDDRYKKYHFIEVMNCKGGCIGGGGQPLCQITQLEKVREQRSKGLYAIDNNRPVRCAHDNKELKILYKNYLKKPLSEDSFKLLHTSYSDKSYLLKGTEK